MNNIVLQVEGMKCGGCESIVKTALEAAEGVDAATADHKLGQVDVDFDPSVISVEQIKEILTGKGYSVRS